MFWGLLVFILTMQMAGREKDCRRVWSVGTSMASGSRGLLAACGLSGQVWRVGQGNCRRVWSVGAKRASGSRKLSAGVVWRREKGEWVKGIVGRVWSVGSSMASRSRELLAEFGLSGQVWRVGQEDCWRSVVCRDKYGEWVKRPVGGVWSVGAKMASGSRELSAGVVCRGENVASGSRELLAECGLSA